MKHAVLGDTRVVDEDIDGTEIRRHLAEPVSASFGVRDVPFVDLNTGLALESVCRLVVARIGGGDLVACCLEALGNGGADAARATSDDCYPCHGSPLFFWMPTGCKAGPRTCS